MSAPDEEPCFHCEIAKLREAQFPSLTIEESIVAMLELVADYVGNNMPLEEQLRLFEFAEKEMMRNRNEVLRGIYKQGFARTRALGAGTH